MGQIVIGVDLDNTLIDYDALMLKVAVERGLLEPGFPRSKIDLRECIRRRHGGESEWRKLQAAVYGPRIAGARLMDGVDAFFADCHRREAMLYIVSHKTERSEYDPTNTSLRTAAMEWMEANRFFDPSGLGIRGENVYFEGTRRDKIDRIRSLSCTHFIDDLAETFLEPDFPANVEMILLDCHSPKPPVPGVKISPNWAQVSPLVFDDCD